MKLRATFERIRRVSLRAAVVSVLLYGTADAANLKEQTVQAWDGYVNSAKARMQQRLQRGNHFLWIDDDQELAAQVRDGEITVSSVGEQNPKKVPSGLIHDWIGAAFLPSANLANVLATVRDYDHYKDFYQPTVMNSKTMKAEGAADRFSMLLMNKSLVVKSALDSDYAISFVRVDDKHWYSISQTTRIQEVEKFGTANQRLLPVDEGTGLIWRMFSISRFEERDGGVYVELEAIALSRDIPATLHWFVAPIVRRVSKGSLFTSLQQTGEAVRSKGEFAKRDVNHEPVLEGASLTSRQTLFTRSALR